MFYNRKRLSGVKPHSLKYPFCKNTNLFDWRKCHWRGFLLENQRFYTLFKSIWYVCFFFSHCCDKMPRGIQLKQEFYLFHDFRAFSLWPSVSDAEGWEKAELCGWKCVMEKICLLRGHQEWERKGETETGFKINNKRMSLVAYFYKLGFTYCSIMGWID